MCILIDGFNTKTFDLKIISIDLTRGKTRKKIINKGKKIVFVTKDKTKGLDPFTVS